MSEINYETYYNTIYAMDPAELQPFRYDVFKVRDDEDMATLEESIKKNGIIIPIMAFWNEYGKLEVIAGHRRIHIAQKLEIPTVPVIIKAVDLIGAKILMAESNLTLRTKLLPSEKGQAYKMMIEAIYKQRHGSKTELTPVESVYDVGERTDEILSNQVGDSREQIRRYIRLNELDPELLNMVDDKKMGLRPAVEISYLPEDIQRGILNYYHDNDVTPSHAQTRVMRRLCSEGKLDSDKLMSILAEDKPNQKSEVDKMVITSPDIIKLLKKYQSKMEKELRIIKALKFLEEAEDKKREEEILAEYN